MELPTPACRRAEEPGRSQVSGLALASTTPRQVTTRAPGWTAGPFRELDRVPRCLRDHAPYSDAAPRPLFPGAALGGLCRPSRFGTDFMFGVDLRLSSEEAPRPDPDGPCNGRRAAVDRRVGDQRR